MKTVPVEQRVKRMVGHALQRFNRRYLAKHPLCEECLKSGRVSAAAEIDHVAPIESGGTHAETNLQALCKPCHVEKTNRDQGLRSGPKQAGSDSSGWPRNPDHPWNQKR
jgi:5-methylcytosine-specific restriction endonuclease McrA